MTLLEAIIAISASAICWFLYLIALQLRGIREKVESASNALTEHTAYYVMKNFS
jgi:hypothetical protein